MSDLTTIQWITGAVDGLPLGLLVGVLTAKVLRKLDAALLIAWVRVAKRLGWSERA